MTDVLTKEQRHRNMAAIRGADTKPEMIVRRMVHAMGYRYRLHVKELPGKPDLVFPRLRSVILVHGCYWHMHDCRYGNVVPATRTGFWQAKRMSNVERDRRNLLGLATAGWTIFIVWECMTRERDLLRGTLQKFLRDRRGNQLEC
jgi:DNA mismatch endonuclease, patch repair protein